MPIKRPELLIIDDRMESVALLLRFFEGQAIDVMVALTGMDGLRKASIGQPDLILLDVTMPNMDGYTVCRKLKSTPETAHIPVLFLSANTSVEHKLQGFAAGAVDYIGKPFHSEEVMARVYVHFKMQCDSDQPLSPAEAAESRAPVMSGGFDTGKESQRESRIVNAAVALLHDPKYLWSGVEALASKVGVIEKRLTELFRKQFGMTVSEYQINRRLERARASLSTTDIQIQRIAEEAGYLNASDFSRAFRQRYGMGPREYRQAGTTSSAASGCA